MKSEIEELISRYPLPPEWHPAEIDNQILTVNSRAINLVGLCSKNTEGSIVTGSAAALSDAPIERSYFELLERVSILEAERNNRRNVCRIFFREGATFSGAKEHVFLKSDAPLKWQYSRSNGVAIHKTWKQAVSSAFLELMERDTLLRSWYGHGNPSPCF